MNESIIALNLLRTSSDGFESSTGSGTDGSCSVSKISPTVTSSVLTSVTSVVCVSTGTTSST